MGKIQDLPPLDRPREKAYRYGISSLSDQELLTLIIGSGFKGINASEIAGKLLSESNGLLGLRNYSLSMICEQKGIKKARALLIATIFEIHRRINKKEQEEIEDKITSEYLYNKYKDQLRALEQEVIIIVILNHRRQIISEQTLYQGTENAVVFSYHQIWEKLYSCKGRSFYLIHNHPHQISAPSDQDIIFTKEIIRESKRIKIPLIDHIIIGENNYYSFLNK